MAKKGQTQPLSVRKKISQKLKGRSTWNKGMAWSEETKKKISESSKGRIPAYTFPKGVSAWNKGLGWSEEIKQKISQSKKGSIPWNLGRARTEEEKQKMRIAAKKMWERRKGKL